MCFITKSTERAQASATLDHDEGLLAAEEERVLINHGLHQVLKVRPHVLKLSHVAEFVR